MSPVLMAAIYLTLLIAVAVIILKVRDWMSALFYRIRNPPALLEAQRQSFESRLRAPDWRFYESQLQRPVPPALQDLFSPRFLSAPALCLGETYLFLSPIDAAGLKENWVAPGVVPFAYSEADPIYLKPGPSATNAVFITYHDGDDTEELAPSIEAFAAGLRVAT